jgi:curli biogenesis system outer membrane secretion channel CsgG
MFARRPFRALTLAVFVPAFLLGACAPTATVRSPGVQTVRTPAGPTIQQIQATPYAGPKKRIAVLAFGDKSAKGYARIGDGMADMLTTELFNTNRFDIIERRELKGIIDEQDFGATGRVKRETAAPIGQIEGAEYLVRGDVTAFEPDRLTIGGAALGLITLGATAVISAKNRTPIGMVTYKEAYLAMDIRIIDARTGRIVNATAVEGKAHDVGGFIAGTVGGGKTRMPLALGGFQGTPMEQAIRIALEAAALHIAQQIVP